MEPQRLNGHEKRRQRTREAIVAAAAVTFVRKGVTNAMVTDIAKAANIGYGTFYNHFDGRDDVISAVAEATMRQVVEVATAVLSEQETSGVISEVSIRGGLVPAVSVRVVMRLMSADPAIRWLLEKPYVFAEEWHKTMTPFILGFVERGEAETPNTFSPAGGAATWIKLQPWMIICQLNEAILKGGTADEEGALADLVLQVVGLNEKARPEVIELSRNLVDAKLSKAVALQVERKAASANAVQVESPER